MAELSVIIPSLNEAAALPLLLADLRQQQGCTPEVIVADGGSTDATVALAEQAGATLVRTPRGRALQMNAGAAHARGEHLLFLHADTRLPSPTLLREALAALKQEGPVCGAPTPPVTRAAVAALSPADSSFGGSSSLLRTRRWARTATGSSRNPQLTVAGHFPLRFSRGVPGHDFLFRYLEGKTALNREFTINGDQGVLLSRTFFDELGGFDPRLPFLEDQRLAAQIWRRGRWMVLPGHLQTSARRFEREGHHARLILMTLMMALHEAGCDEFFALAPQVYATQDRTGTLDLAAFHHLIRQTLWRAGVRRAAQILFRCGRFVRQNTWQLFYRHDLKRARPGKYPTLAFYDRHVNWFIANPVGDLLATLLMCAWFFLWLPLSQQR